jgi:hypothetical protein
MLPAVPVAVADAGTLDHVRPELLVATSSQTLLPAKTYCRPFCVEVAPTDGLDGKENGMVLISYLDVNAR